MAILRTHSEPLSTPDEASHVFQRERTLKIVGVITALFAVLVAILVTLHLQFKDARGLEEPSEEVPSPAAPE